MKEGWLQFPIYLQTANVSILAIGILCLAALIKIYENHHTKTTIHSFCNMIDPLSSKSCCWNIFNFYSTCRFSNIPFKLGLTQLIKYNKWLLPSISNPTASNRILSHTKKHWSICKRDSVLHFISIPGPMAATDNICCLCSKVTQNGVLQPVLLHCNVTVFKEQSETVHF